MASVLLVLFGIEMTVRWVRWEKRKDACAVADGVFVKTPAGWVCIDAQILPIGP